MNLGGLRAVAVLQGLLVATSVAGGVQLLSEPIRNGDYTAHFQAAAAVRTHLDRAAALWGYDPSWMAGYPEGVISLVDAKLFQAALAVAPVGRDALFFNVTIVLSLLLVPGLSALASRAADDDADAAAAAGLGAVVVTFTLPLAVFFWAGGALAFFLASALVVPALVLLARALDDEGLFSRQGLLGSALSTLAVAVHPAVALVLAFGLAASLWRPAQGLPRVLAGLFVLGLLWTAPTLPFLDAALALGGQLRPVIAPGFLEGRLGELVDDGWRNLFTTRPGWAGGVGGVVALLVVAGFGRSRAVGRSPALGRALAAAIGGSALLSYGSTLVPALALLQPRRFLVSLGFLLCVPAGAGLARLLRERRRRRAVFALSAALAMAIIAEAGFALRPAAVVGPGLDDSEPPLAAFLGGNVGRGERALVESAWVDVPAAPDDARPIRVKRFALLPAAIGRELIGNPGPGSISAQRILSFSYARVAGRLLATVTPAELAAFLDRYAIAWAVACRPETDRALTRFATVLERGIGIGDCRVYRVRGRAPSLFLAGSGSVVAERDRIEVRGAVGERVVLKYHWMPTLQTEPSVPIEEAPLPGAPVGFISIRPQGYDRIVIVQKAGGIAGMLRRLADRWSRFS